MRPSHDYEILSIRDACSSVNQKVNIIAIVVEFAFPKPTAGTDYCCALRIIDESHYETGMAVNVFCNSTEKLPHVAEAGDVILLCRVMVKAHGGEVNFVFNKSFSSFALYKGKVGDDFVAYQNYSKFQVGEKVKMDIDRIRKWLANVQLNEDRDYPLFREFKEGDHINLACKILHCCKIAQEWFVFVWDGTDAPPNTIFAKLEDEMRCPLPLQIEPVPLPRDILCTFPTLGSILRIKFQRIIDEGYLNVINNNKWIKFINIRLEVHSGLWCAVYTPFSKFRYTSAQDSLILERKRLSDERLSLKYGSMSSGSFPLPSCVTVLPVKYDLVPFVTLMDVLTHSEVTAKFKCLVRVVAALPYQAEMLRAPSGPYRMRLTLEDPTARIQAIVFAEDGETLFEGYPSADSLTSKLNTLLGVTECDDSSGKRVTVRNPPWVGVCLKSYYLKEDDEWGSRQFRIFDTKIVEA